VALRAKKPLMLDAQILILMKLTDDMELYEDLKRTVAIPENLKDQYEGPPSRASRGASRKRRALGAPFYSPIVKKERLLGRCREYGLLGNSGIVCLRRTH